MQIYVRNTKRINLGMSKSQLNIILLKFLYSYLGFIHLMGHFNEKAGEGKKQQFNNFLRIINWQNFMTTILSNLI